MSRIRHDDGPHWTVFKFGGTSMGTVDSLRRSLSITLAHIHKGKSCENGENGNDNGICSDDVEENIGKSNDNIDGNGNVEPRRLAVVVSAMSGVTDSLLKAASLSEKRDGKYKDELMNIRKRHTEAAKALILSSDADLHDGKDAGKGINDDDAADVNDSNDTTAHNDSFGFSSGVDSRAFLFSYGCHMSVSKIFDAYLGHLEESLEELNDLLRAVWVAKHCPHELSAAIVGTGEVLSAPLFASLLAAEEIRRMAKIDGNSNDSSVANDASDKQSDNIDGSSSPANKVLTYACDSREIIVIENGDDHVPVIDWNASENAVAKEKALAKYPPTSSCAEDSNPSVVVVFPGFVCQDSNGAPSTLRRNGSDFSASIIGALLKAAEVTIWTDVDGVYSADPRIVPQAKRLERMSYEEAMELSNCGAKVLHAQTMAPAVASGIPIRVKSTFNPDSPGTVIGNDDPNDRKKSKKNRRKDNGEDVNDDGSDDDGECCAVHECIKGIVTIPDVALLNLQGTGMVGVPGVSERLFGCLRRVGVSVIVIAQASSEHSISIAIKAKHAEISKQAVTQEFYRELDLSLTQVSVETGCAILAAVGDGMSHTIGIAAAIFRALAIERINVRAIAQGSGERNISVVLSEDGQKRALKAVHRVCVETAGRRRSEGNWRSEGSFDENVAEE